MHTYTFLYQGRWHTFESDRKLSSLEVKTAQVQIEGCIKYIPAIGRLNPGSTDYISSIPEKYHSVYPCNSCLNATPVADGWSICNAPTPTPLS